MNKLKYFVFTIFSVLVITGCQADYIPKPKAYHRLILPQKKYVPFGNKNCPFSFEIPAYASTAKDTLFFGQAPSDPCWMDISFNSMNGKIHLSYKNVGQKNTLEKLLEDTYKLTSKHVRKADFIDEQVFHNNDTHGLLYDVGGDAASPLQFFVTDSTQHFLRGALYFQTQPNYDSILPVVDFIKEDVLHLMETFEWE